MGRFTLLGLDGSMVWRVLGSSILGGMMLACSGAVESSPGSGGEGPPATQTSTLCAGSRIDAERTTGCTDPYRIRHGHACSTPDELCPSANLLQGECRCDDGTWSCAKPSPPDGYDPYPDCSDRGVTTGDACYLESSTCLAASATACFTSNVPLCVCTGHSWDCPL